MDFKALFAFILKQSQYFNNSYLLLYLHTKYLLMKSFIIVLFFFSCISTLFGQRISKIALSSAGDLQTFAITTDDNAIINLSPTGDVISYGTEYFSEKIQNYSRIEKFNGRVDLYGATDDKSLQGKLKYIGKTAVTYYASYDIETLRGKIKNIGNLAINYFMEYDDVNLKGKIKSIGSSQMQYFSSFDNEALRLKLKSVGSTAINYYTSFEDKAIKGKLKSIGQTNFTYYTSFEKQFAGAMKTGSQQLNVSGIAYFVQ